MAFGFWFLFLRKSEDPPKDASSQSTPEASPTTWVASKLNGLEPEEQTELDRVAREREKIRAEAQEAAAADREATMDSKDKIARAERVVKEAGLDADLASLWEEVRYWPSWTTNPTGYDLPEGFSSVWGFESASQSEKVSSWEWGGKSYEMKYIRHHNYTPDADWNPRDLHLSVDGEEVLVQSYNDNYSEFGSSLRYTGVDALRVGSWMADVVRMVGHLRRKREDRLKQSIAATDAAKASRIKL